MDENEAHIQDLQRGRFQRYPFIVPLRKKPCFRPECPYPAPPGLQWFDVALWKRRLPGDFPEWAGPMLATTPLQAIEKMMQQYCVRYVAYASAYSYDYTIVYRCFHVVVKKR